MTTPTARPPADALVSPHIRSVLAPNAGPMTLDGTNSLVLSADDEHAIVVDPGPPDPGHLAALTAGPPVELILITHHHIDHVEAAAQLSEQTGAPVRAFAPEHCHGGGTPLVDGERITAAGLDIEVVHTPGHCADSVCFVVDSDDAVLTGDTILGRGTTVIDDLGAYLRTLQRLAEIGSSRPMLTVPAHGPMIPDLRVVAETYLDHRRRRLAQVASVLDRLGPDAADAAVVAAVLGEFYEADIDLRNRPYAEKSIQTQLDHLRQSRA